MNTVKRFYFYLKRFFQEITGNLYFPEYSGISLILSVERGPPEMMFSMSAFFNCAFLN